MAWYDEAVFYHIYPLGLCGCAHENDGQPTPGAFAKLEAWAAHAAKLGCTAIYIGPLFESGSHGYDTIDYRLVDRRLGTNEEFKAFVAACHARGQRVIVDGVFNHVGRDFFAFQDLKSNRENARYKDWFCDVNFWGNNEYNDGFSYGNWGGYNLLVKLNQRNPEVQQYHYDTVRFWVEQFDIDGIRLDAADVLDFDFMRRLQGLCHDTRLYLFSDNHDVERLPNKLRNREHIRHIAILVYSLWGIPSIYYGSEFGIEGKKEWGSDWPLRPCLELSDYADAERTNPVTSVYKVLGKCKAELPEMTYGEVKELQLTTQCYAFARVLDGKAVVAVLNNGDTPAQLEFQLPVEAAKVTDLMADTVGAQEVLVSTEWNRMKVQLPSNYATLLRVE